MAEVPTTAAYNAACTALAMSFPALKADHHDIATDALIYCQNLDGNNLVARTVSKAKLLALDWIRKRARETLTLNIDTAQAELTDVEPSHSNAAPGDLRRTLLKSAGKIQLFLKDAAALLYSVLFVNGCDNPPELPSTAERRCSPPTLLRSKLNTLKNETGIPFAVPDDFDEQLDEYIRRCRRTGDDGRWIESEQRKPATRAGRPPAKQRDPRDDGDTARREVCNAIARRALSLVGISAKNLQAIDDARQKLNLRRRDRAAKEFNKYRHMRRP